MDTEESSAPHAHPSTEDHDHACIDGWVFVGHLVLDEDGKEVEVFQTVPCRRCAEEAR